MGGTLIVAESYGNRLTASDIGPDGGLASRRVWAEPPGDHPDGICLDADGAVWYADVGNPRLFVVGHIYGGPEPGNPAGGSWPSRRPHPAPGTGPPSPAQRQARIARCPAPPSARPRWRPPAGEPSWHGRRYLLTGHPAMSSWLKLVNVISAPGHDRLAAGGRPGQARDRGEGWPPEAERGSGMSQKTPSGETLSGFVVSAAGRSGVPGAAAGVWADGQEVYACHGVTSIENPLPVDPDTVFVIGSVTKTFTATAMMCLVAAGKVDLESPVRRYVPEFTLKDEQAAAAITVLNLLNHTAGLDWRMSAETGEGDDALALYVAEMAEFELIAPPGARASYSQVGYNLAGRVIEKVTGLSFERAVASLLLEPLGLSHTFFFAAEVMTRRFAVGHNLGPDGTLSVARQWKDTRANNPGGDAGSSVADLLAWAKFHLGDGHAGTGGQVLPAAVLRQMRQQTADLRGSSLGDALGIGWFLRDIGGVRTVGHDGSANGQFASLLTVPERDFAVAVLSNAGPDSGLAVNQAVVRWALEHYLGVANRNPEPLPYDPARAAEIAGIYENDMMRATFRTDGAGLTVEFAIKPEIRTATGTELPQTCRPPISACCPARQASTSSPAAA
jgi:CubicO group peptidase (beta-lactamase class C family)